MLLLQFLRSTVGYHQQKSLPKNVSSGVCVITGFIIIIIKRNALAD